MYIIYAHSNGSGAHLLEVLLLTMGVCAGFVADVIWMSTGMCGVTSEPTQNSSRCVSSFKDSSALLNI